MIDRLVGSAKEFGKYSLLRGDTAAGITGFDHIPIHNKTGQYKRVELRVLCLVFVPMD